MLARLDAENGLALGWGVGRLRCCEAGLKGLFRQAEFVMGRRWQSQGRRCIRSGGELRVQVRAIHTLLNRRFVQRALWCVGFGGGSAVIEATRVGQ